MASYEAFLPYVLPETPGCPEIVAVQAIRSSAIDFCERSLILQRDHDPVTLVKGIIDYDFDPPLDNTLVTKLMRAWFQRDEVEAVAPDMVNDVTVYNALFANANAITGPTKQILQKDERTFTVFPKPDQTYQNALTMRVALKPTRASSTCDDVLFEDYAEFIAHGAKARLCITPGKPYTAPDVAALGNAMFMQGVNRALQRGVRGHTRSTLSVRMRSI